MTVVLTYTTKDGIEEQAEFEDDIGEIDLSRRKIIKIDLTPLRSCSKLHHLNLYGNNLENIDLAPLAFNENSLSVDLSGNYLRTVDVTPLFTCSKLVQIGADYNSLRQSWISRTADQTIYERPARKLPWPILYKIAEEYGVNRRVQQDVFACLGFSDYGFVDQNMVEFLTKTPPETPIEKVCEKTRQILLEILFTAIEKEASTIGLNLDRLSKIYPKLATRVPEIIKQREREMQRIKIAEIRKNMVNERSSNREIYFQNREDKKYDLRQLWLTAYGYEILKALRMRLVVDTEELEQVKDAFNELGFDLKIGRVSIPGVGMSDELKEAIWWIASYKRRYWTVIETLEYSTKAFRYDNYKFLRDIATSEMEEGESVICTGQNEDILVTKENGVIAVRSP